MMIDIHSHILPGIDDGASDMYDALEMVKMAADSGVRAMVATPHCIPGVYDNYFSKEYVEAVKRMRKAVKEERIPVQILPGMEAFATYDLPKRIEQKKIMPLNQSSYMLMEFAFDEDPDYACEILRRVRELGVRPVVAHAERYEFLQDNPRLVYEWCKKGYSIQVNKGSFMGRFGRRARAAAYRFMDHNLVTAIASDAHSPYQRTPHMLETYEELLTEYPEDYLKVLFDENPRRICENMPTVRFELISFEEDGIY